MKKRQTRQGYRLRLLPKIFIFLVMFSALLLGVYALWPQREIGADPAQPTPPGLVRGTNYSAPPAPVRGTNYPSQNHPAPSPVSLPAEEPTNDPINDPQNDPIDGSVDDPVEDLLSGDYAGDCAGGTSVLSRFIPLSEIEDTQYLKLVNRALALHTPLCHSRLVTVWPHMAARDNTVRLHGTAFTAIQKLLAGAREAGFGTFFIASGYRSHAHQAQLYANAANRAYVMPAGHSEHQLGLAADILKLNGTFNGMRGTDAARWLAENAPRFGLILRYAYDKQDITEVAYEPWHFRYVGRAHAQAMARHNFAMEEYIAFLREAGFYQTYSNGTTYYIWYRLPVNGTIPVPQEFPFTVSCANTGGYIVTARR